MLTTINFTSKLSGALLTKNIIKLSVTMLITGKISEENHISLTTMLTSFAQTGKPVHLLVNMKKVVFYKPPVFVLMDGKNKNITLFITRQDLALK